MDKAVLNAELRHYPENAPVGIKDAAGIFQPLSATYAEGQQVILETGRLMMVATGCVDCDRHREMIRDLRDKLDEISSLAG